MTRPTSRIQSAETVPRLAAKTGTRPAPSAVSPSSSGVKSPARSSVAASSNLCAALGEPRQRLRWHAALCDRSLESSSSTAHTLCTVGTAHYAAATAVTAMGSPSLALSHLCCGLCERHCSRRLPAHCETPHGCEVKPRYQAALGHIGPEVRSFSSVDGNTCLLAGAEQEGLAPNPWSQLTRVPAAGSFPSSPSL